MMKRGLFIITVVSVLFLFAGCALVADKDLEGTTWKLITVSGVDFSVVDLEYILIGGTGTATITGFATGNGFTYVVAGNLITISGAAAEGLLDDSYTYSIDGKNMTWKQLGVTIYTFRAQ
jgi:hypothetical protein